MTRGRRSRDPGDDSEAGDRSCPRSWCRSSLERLKQRNGCRGRIVSVAVIVAVCVNGDGRREVLGMKIGALEAETFWADFLRSLARRGLRGVKLVISDAHEGLKGAIAKILNATWQRCGVHFMRNALAHAGKSGSRVVSAFIATAFAQDDAEAAKTQWRQVADQLKPKLPKLAALMHDAEADVLAYMSFKLSAVRRNQAGHEGGSNGWSSAIDTSRSVVSPNIG